MVFGENCLHLNPNLEGWMAPLLVPEIHTLKDALGDLSFDMIEGEVSVNFFAFCAVHIPVCLHSCGQRVNNGDRALILNNICCFLLACSVHVNVSPQCIIYKGVWL